MNVNEIEKILARYYDGKTNEAEEKELKRFFTRKDVPAHLLADKHLFTQLHAGAEPSVPQYLGDKLEALINEWEAHDRQKQEPGKRNRQLQWIRNIAAGIIILLSAGLYLHRYYAPSTPPDTCSTSEEAYAQAQKALVKLSVSLNKGIRKVESMQETTEKIEKNINEQLNRFNNIKP